MKRVVARSRAIIAAIVIAIRSLAGLGGSRTVAITCVLQIGNDELAMQVRHLHINQVGALTSQGNHFSVNLCRDLQMNEKLKSLTHLVFDCVRSWTSLIVTLRRVLLTVKHIGRSEQVAHAATRSCFAFKKGGGHDEAKRAICDVLVLGHF